MALSFRSIRYHSAALVLALTLAACSGQNNGGDDAATPGDSASPDASASAAAATPVPSDFTRTAWQIEGTDGARYTTYIDAGGRYRDIRNGQPWHEGSWETGSDGSLCFTPDGDNVLRRCWHPDNLSDKGMLTATGEDGTEIELTEVDYSAPGSARGTASTKAAKHSGAK